MSQHVKRASTSVLLVSLWVLTMAGCEASSRGSTEEPGGAAAAPASVDGGSQEASVANQIIIDNFTFRPATLTVAVGTKVTWVNRDDVPHTATSTAKPKVFDSRTLDTDAQYSHVFTAPGIYPYFCAVHPHMTGQIVVK